MKKDDHTKPALVLIEDAVDILRSDPVHFLLPYYLGSVPFYLAVLFFVTDMRSAFAEERLVPAALFLSVLFIVMKLFQSVFALRIYDRAAHTEHSRIALPSLFERISFQAGVHATAVIVLPVALLITVPYVFAVSFYQNALSIVPGKGETMKATLQRIKSVAAYAPKQNHMVYLIFMGIRLGVLVNAGAIVFTIPHLLKMLFGVESVFTMGGYSPMNSTFIVTVLVTAQLVSDPLFKAVHSLRCFYGEAERTGEDLKSELKSLKKAGKTTALILLASLGILFSSPALTLADQAVTVPKPEKTTAISPDDLDHNIGRVITGRDFAWRMPREKEDDVKKKDGLMDRFIAWLKPYTDKINATLSRWGDKISEWLKKLFPEWKPPAEVKEKPPRPLARYLLFGLLASAIAVLVFFILRTVIAGRREALELQGDRPKKPDLSDESVSAGDLPPSAWRELAKELMEKGEFRLAMRALYFETLSTLAETGFLSIASHKSNREYQAELALKAHEKKDMIDLFRFTVGLVDRVWYGSALIDGEALSEFLGFQERIVAHAR